MTLRLVRPCDVPSCEREATLEITRVTGEHVAWHCEDCMAVIRPILEETDRLVRLGTPRRVAAHWAARRPT